MSRGYRPGANRLRTRLERGDSINAALLFPESLRYFLTDIAAFRPDLCPRLGSRVLGGRTLLEPSRARGGSVPRSRRDSLVIFDRDW